MSFKLHQVFSITEQLLQIGEDRMTFQVNGKGPYQVLIDSGASDSCWWWLVVRNGVDCGGGLYHCGEQRELKNERDHSLWLCRINVGVHL